MTARIHSLSFKLIAVFLLLTFLSVALLNIFAYRGSNALFAEQTEKAMTSTLTFRGDLLIEKLAPEPGSLDREDRDAAAVDDRT